MVEPRTFNPIVVGSIPTTGLFFFASFCIIKESQIKIAEYYNRIKRAIENAMKISKLKSESKTQNTLMDLERKLNELDKWTKKNICRISNI